MKLDSYKLTASIKSEVPSLYGHLEDLWKEVAPSANYTKVLFPEYTPHDETHIERLFAISDQLLSPYIINGLSNLERFLLAAGIIAHDWGMGVSRVEQEAIINGKEGELKYKGPAGEWQTDALLPNEASVFRAYCDVIQVEIKWTSSGGVESQHINYWRDYIRNTHPERSAEKIRLHFANSEPHLGEAIALIAHGHGIDRQIIESARYPALIAINGADINIQALALYLRLIDLLDISKGRAPFELWKYVNPGDQTSAREWKKHRALEEPLFEERVIKWSARTNESSVLAALYDLKAYCDAELHWQCLLLERNSPLRYHYSRRQMDWDVIADGGLNPTPVRFTFSRDPLLQLVSDEIYGGDPYVFIREMLQNAIDATSIRIEQRKLASHECAIEVIVHEVDGTKAVTFRDVGTGMTEYIINNYLSVVGRSYYRSGDFSKLRLSVDPISKFGIGVLSCFAVAARVIIKTKADPACFHAQKAPEAWEVEIKSGRDGLPLGYWEWKKLQVSSMDFGTEVTVFIDNEKQRRQIAQAVPERHLSGWGITEYIKQIAGFVTVPITIRENGRKTVVLPPYSAAPSDAADTVVSSLPRDYSLSSDINAADLENAVNVLEVVTHDLSAFGVPGLSGFLSYPKPKKPWRAIERHGQSIKFIDEAGKTIELRGPTFTSGRDMGLFEVFDPHGPSRSAMRSKRLAVYSDGLLVPITTAPNEIGSGKRYTSSVLAAPRLFVNFTGKAKSLFGLGPSRREFRQDRDWAEHILEIHSYRMSMQVRDELLALRPHLRLLRIMELSTQDFVSLDVLTNVLGQDDWPVPLLLKGGLVEVKTFREIKYEPILMEAPRLISKAASKKLLSSLRNNDSGPLKILKSWALDLCVFDLLDIPDLEFKCVEFNRIVSQIIGGAFRISAELVALRSFSILKKGRTLIPLPPFFTRKWVRGVGEKIVFGWNHPDPIGLFERGSKDPSLLNEGELTRLTQIFPTSFRFRRSNQSVPSRFASCVLWSENEINISTPKGMMLVRFFCAYCSARQKGRLSEVDVAKLERLLTGLKIRPWSDHDRKENSLASVNDRLAAVYEVITRYEPSLAKVVLEALDLLPGAFVFLSDDQFLCFNLSGDLIPLKYLEGAAKGPSGEILNADWRWP